MAKICMVAYTYYAYDTRVRREAESLVERGDKVDFICLREKGQENIETINGVKIFHIYRGKYMGTNLFRYLVQYFLFFTKTFLTLTVKHLKNRYDVIQIHTMPDFLVFTAIIPKIMRAKVILDVHDLMPELYMSKFGLKKNNLLIKFIIFVERLSINFANKAIAVHKAHLLALINHGNSSQDFDILLNVPDTKIFTSKKTNQNIHKKNFKLIYHGTISKRHGLDIAIRAVGLCRQEITNLEFMIIGGGDYQQELIELVNKLRLNDIVHISKSPIPITELPTVISQADVGIVPIYYDEFTKYMLPVKLLEYIFIGIPVIVTRTPTIEAYFNDTMVKYFQSGNVEEIAQCIKDLYYKPLEKKSLVENANTFNKKYNWENEKLIYYRLIDSQLNVK